MAVECFQQLIEEAGNHQSGFRGCDIPMNKLDLPDILYHENLQPAMTEYRLFIPRSIIMERCAYCIY